MAMVGYNMDRPAKLGETCSIRQAVKGKPLARVGRKATDLRGPRRRLLERRHGPEEGRWAANLRKTREGTCSEAETAEKVLPIRHSAEQRA